MNTVAKTQKNLEKNLKDLATSPKQPKKTTRTSGTTRKAKAKTSKTTSTRQKTTAPGKPRKKPSELKVMSSRKKENFPWIETFPIYLKNETEDKKCWFTCIEHAQKYVDRHNPKYKCYQYTGK